MLTTALNSLGFSKRRLVIALVVVCVVLLTLLVFLQFYKVSFASNSFQISKVIARVHGVAISEQDLKNYERVYPLLGVTGVYESGLAGLKLLVKIEEEAQKQGITISSQELEDEGNFAKPATSSASIKKTGDALTAATYELLAEKLSDKLTFWREAEFISVRTDVLPTGQELSEEALKPYIEKAKQVLGTVEERVKKGESVETIAQELRFDPTITKDFIPSAVQYFKLSDDAFKRRSERINKTLLTTGTATTNNQNTTAPRMPTRKEVLPSEKHILEMSVPSQEIWCGPDHACYLFKVSAGSNGKYETLQDWIKEQK